jgi:hypothetical protein
VSWLRRGRGKQEEADPVAWASEDSGATRGSAGEDDPDAAPGLLLPGGGRPEGDPDAALFTPHAERPAEPAREREPAGRSSGRSGREPAPEAGREPGREAGRETPAPRPPAVADTTSGNLRTGGPWDVTELDDPYDTDGYVDLGALRLPGRDGMELRLEVEEASGRVTAATVQLGQSAVQLQAFAAPRPPRQVEGQPPKKHEGIWPQIRAEIAGSVTRQGGTADEVPGPFGTELLARIPSRTSDGRTSHQPARFAGIDGPRWFLRAVFHGEAAYEPRAAHELEQFVRDVVVVRGQDAMAPRELLSLRLPDAPAQEEEEPQGAGREPIAPFRRGPEITEVR